MRRDARVVAELSVRGWTVVRFWEHELVTRVDIDIAVEECV